MTSRKSSFRLEEELLAPVIRYVKRQGFRLLRPELRFFEHRIDLFGLSRPSGDTIAVELKMRDWRRALKQALIYQLCSDYAYIALPEGREGSIDLAELAKDGVGLILVGGEKGCRSVLAASKSTETRDYYRREYAQLLRRHT